MRAGRLLEIFDDEDIIVEDENAKHPTMWGLRGFAKRFPYCEIIAVYIRHNCLIAQIHNKMAKLLYDEKFDEAAEHHKLETYMFDSDVDYIKNWDKEEKE